MRYFAVIKQFSSKMPISKVALLFCGGAIVVSRLLLVAQLKIFYYLLNAKCLRPHCFAVVFSAVSRDTFVRRLFLVKMQIEGKKVSFLLKINMKAGVVAPQRTDAV